MKHESSRNSAKKTYRPRRITLDYLKNSGLYYLQRFAASSGRFRSVMTRKITRSCQFHTDLDREECLRLLDSVIGDFQRAGLLDDISHAKGLAASLRRKGKSRKAVTASLMAKEVDPSIIRSTLDEIDQNENHGEAEMRAALIFMRKRRAGPFSIDKPDRDEEKSRTKLLQALARGGFSYDIAAKAMDMPPEEAQKRLTL